VHVAVVGAGIMGAASAWALTRAGHDVSVHEQFELDHGRGSSHGPTRIFRLAYTDRAWVERAREALAAWRALEAETREALLELDGLVECFPSIDQSSAAELNACGVAWHEVEPAPHGIVLPEGWSALIQPEAGVIRADRARRALLGDTPVERGRVDSLDDLDADTVVVAAGPWAPSLLARHGIGLDVVTTRETVVYFGHELPGAAAVVDRDAQRHLHYAVRDPVHGLKAGVHMSGAAADPDEPGDADPAAVEHVSRWVASRFAGADPEPLAADTCFYTTTADESFVLERHGRVVVCSACSGHGFKFAPLVGRRVAELVGVLGG
jgi:glycine/D-amino acid oxidase-like deaminating enzyme